MLQVEALSSLMKERGGGEVGGRFYVLGGAVG